MSMTVRVQLSIMMFLQFFVWGAYYVTMGTYLDAIGFDGGQIGAVYGCMALASIISPFFVGMIADRFFSAQLVMGVLHLLGGGIMWYVSGVQDPTTFYWAFLAYTITYAPTLALVNAISFNQMEDPGKEFPNIRVMGTIGWIIAGLAITLVLSKMYNTGDVSVEATAIPLKMAAICSLILGAYSFLLPNTPPKPTDKPISIGDILGLEALSLMKDRSFLIFTIGSILVCIPLAFYYTFANLFFNESGMEGVAGKMSMGQMSEIVFMVLMPFFFKRLGVKKMLLIGMLAWVARYVLFAYGNADSMVMMFYAGILLHGICYDFFFVTGQIYVDNEAPKEIQASAQGFVALITYGVGMFIGAWACGKIVGIYTAEDGSHAWQTIWLIPAGMAFAVVVLFALLFKDKPIEEDA